MSETTEYTVTGIRFQMDSKLTYDQKTEAAKAFVASLKRGDAVMLKAEPRNAHDPNAVAVFYNCKRIGYISAEEAEEVHVLLNERQMCNGIVERTTDHITFFITIPATEGKEIPKVQHKRVLPASPLGTDVRLAFTKEESELEVVATMLEDTEVTKENAMQLIELAERYVPLARLSMCREDIRWQNRISKILNRIRTKQTELGLTAEQAERIDKAWNTVNNAVRELHRVHEDWRRQQVFKEHLERISKDWENVKYFYGKYCRTFLDAEDFGKADKERMMADLERLYKWLHDMEWSELRNRHDLDAMALKVFYLKLSRDELYDLYSVLLLTDKLAEQVGEALAEKEKIVDELAPIFNGDKEEARVFLNQIQEQDAVNITNRVRQYVEAEMIDENKKGSPLYNILFKYGIYTKSLSNWNNMVK